MDVDDAKIREEAKAILKEIMDPSPDPKKEQIEIWEAWFDQMADGGQPPEIVGTSRATRKGPRKLYQARRNSLHRSGLYAEKREGRMSWSWRDLFALTFFVQLFGAAMMANVSDGPMHE